MPQKPRLGSAALQPDVDPKSEGNQWCVGRWSYPQNCRFQLASSPETIAYLKQPIEASLKIRPLPLELSDCSYYAQWQYLEASDSIDFVIQTKTRNRWTGIGFSNGTRMANSDAIIGLIEELSGRHFVMDTWLRDHVMPEIDLQQNTDHTSGKRENGTTTIRFRRKRLTNDQFDFQFTDDSCAYFFFPTQGGSFNAISKRLHKHDVNPSVSKQKICVKKCSKQTDVMESTTTEQQQTTTSQPVQSSSDSPSQAPNLFLLSSSSTTTSTSTTTLPTNVNSSMDKIGLDTIVNFSSQAPSNDLNVELDSSSTASGSQTSSSPGVNQLGSQATGSNSNLNFFNKLSFLSEPSLRWLAGIGCVATLLAMIVFQACFTVYKNKQAYKENLYRQSAFKQNTAAYLHGAYITDSAHHHHNHQPSTGSEETQTASLHNSVTKIAPLTSSTNSSLPAESAQQLPARPRAHHQHSGGHHQRQHMHQHQHQHQHLHPHRQQNRSAPVHPFQARPNGPYMVPQVATTRLPVHPAGYDAFATEPSATESSEQEEELDEEELEEEELEELEELDEEELDEEYEDDMMIEPGAHRHHGGHHHHSAHHHGAHHHGAHHYQQQQQQQQQLAYQQRHQLTYQQRQQLAYQQRQQQLAYQQRQLAYQRQRQRHQSHLSPR